MDSIVIKNIIHIIRQKFVNLAFVTCLKLKHIIIYVDRAVFLGMSF